MKVIERIGVFETNSSSCHSLSLERGGTLNQTMYPDDDGVIRVTGGEFGWEYDTYSSPYDKANYLAVAWDDQPEKLKLLEQAIIEHTGAKTVDLSNIQGYIDHQSYGITDEIQTLDDVKSFLFNSGSYVETDNDNHELKDILCFYILT